MITEDILEDHPDDSMVLRAWKQRKRKKLKGANKCYRLIINNKDSKEKIQ
jgi:hypothetical protein